MKSIASTLLLSALVSASGFCQDNVPGEIRKYAEGLTGSLAEMISSDPNMMKELGAAGYQVGKLKLDFGKAFEMNKIDPTKLEGSKNFSQAVSGTGAYYVPLCGDKGCPMMAAFSMDARTHEPMFQTVGQANLLHQIQETQAVAGEGARVVDYPEGHVGFLLSTKAGGEEVLIPQSEAEGRAMLADLDRPPAETDSKGRPRFSLSDMRQIAKTVREHAESAPTAPETGFDDPSHFNVDKPANDAPGSAARTMDANGSVVLAIDPPKPGASAPTASAEQPSSAETPKEAKASEVSEPEHASPVLATSMLLAVLLGGGFLVWKLRRRGLY